MGFLLPFTPSFTLDHILSNRVSYGKYKCSKCKKELDDFEAYEYRGAISCEEHFDEVIEMRSFQRQEVINEEHNKTKVFKGLDLDPTNPIGKANRDILSKQIEIASKESGRLKEYEGR